jgi:hypothetical protein
MLNPACGHWGATSEIGSSVVWLVQAAGSLSSRSDHLNHPSRALRTGEAPVFAPPTELRRGKHQAHKEGLLPVNHGPPLRDNLFPGQNTILGGTR